MTIANDNKAVVAPTSLTDDVTEFVTVIIGGQLFGMPISRVQDVFMPEQLTRVPLSQREIAGVLNLRGRIVTAIDMRCRLGLGCDCQPFKADVTGADCTTRHRDYFAVRDGQPGAGA